MFYHALRGFAYSDQQGTLCGVNAVASVASSEAYGLPGWIYHYMYADMSDHADAAYTLHPKPCTLNLCLSCRARRD